MTAVRRAVGAVAAVAVAVSLSLTGCAGQQTDYGPEAADRLQAEVLEVSQLAAGADYTAAMVSLSELEVELKGARARGDVTDERYESVMAALALVRADLQAAIDAATPDPPVSSGDDDDGNKGKGKGKDKD